MPGSPRRSSPKTCPDGYATPTVAAAVALSLWTFALIVNLVVLQYASGVVRTAAWEAAREGAVWGAEECSRRIEEILSELLGGAYGDLLRGTCHVDVETVTVRIEGTLPGLVPPMPDLHASHIAQVVRR